MADEIMVPGPKTGLSEFFYVRPPYRSTTRWLTGFCGGHAVAHAIALSDQKLVSYDLMEQVYQRFRSWGGDRVMSDNGVTSMGAMIGFLGHYNYPIVKSSHWTGEVPMAGAYNALRDFSGLPVMVQTQQGQYLRNELTGSGERADLTKPLSHFITAVGKVGRPFQDEAHQTQDQRGGWSNWANRRLPAGLWFADGDSADLAHEDPKGRLVYYSEQRLRQARLDSYAEVGLKAAPQGGTAMLELAQVSGWFKVSGDGWEQIARPDLIIRGGILESYRNYPSVTGLYGFAEFGLPLALEEVCLDAHGNPLPKAWRIVCERGVLVVDNNHAYDRPPGVAGAYYRGHILAKDAPLFGAPAISPITPQDAKILAAAKAAKAQLEALAGALG